MLFRFKKFFLIVVCFLLLGISFLFLVFPGQKTTLAVDFSGFNSNSPTVFDADEGAKSWSPKQKQKVMNVGNIHLIIAFLFSGSPEIVAADSEGKEWTYKFDQVVSAFEKLAEDGKIPISFVNLKWSQLSSSAQNQVLQFYETDGSLKTGDIRTKWDAQYKKTIADTWNAIQPLIYLMNTLGIQGYQSFLGKIVSFHSPVEHDKWDYSKKYTYDQISFSRIFTLFYLKNLLYKTTSLPFVQQTLTAALDKEWFPKLQLLQSAPGLASLRIDEKDVDVSSLTSSDAQSIAGLNKDQTDNLVKLKDITIQGLEKLVAPHTAVLTNYKNTIQSGLDLFAKYGITDPILNDTKYDLSELLKANNINKTAAELFPDVAQQLKVLSDEDITSQHFITAFNLLINPYRTQLKPGLDKFEQYGISSNTLNNDFYQLANLQGANLASDQDTWSYNPEVHTELSALYKVATRITPQHFIDAFNTLINQYRDDLKKGIELFKKYDITNPYLNGKAYQLTNLLSVDLAAATWGYNSDVHTELSTLYKGKGSGQVVADDFETALNLLINPYRNGLRKGILLFEQYGLSNPTLNGNQYSLAELQRESLATDVWGYSSGVYTELSTLYKGKENSGQVVANDFETAFNLLINPYRNGLKKGIELFERYGVNNPTLNLDQYILTELQGQDLTLVTWEYNSDVHNELGEFYKGKAIGNRQITADDFTTAFAPIKTYKDSIQNNLNLFVESHITTFTLDDVDYQLNHLLDTNNLDKPATALSPAAAKQLKTLYDAKIKSEDFETALNQILTAEKQTTEQKAKETKKAEETKKAKSKTALTIGLAMEGGVLLLAGGAGGFLYWFYKIKK